MSSLDLISLRHCIWGYQGRKQDASRITTASHRIDNAGRSRLGVLLLLMIIFYAAPFDSLKNSVYTYSLLFADAV